MRGDYANEMVKRRGVNVRREEMQTKVVRIRPICASYGLIPYGDKFVMRYGVE